MELSVAEHNAVRVFGGLAEAWSGQVEDRGCYHSYRARLLSGGSLGYLSAYVTDVLMCNLARIKGGACSLDERSFVWMEDLQSSWAFDGGEKLKQIQLGHIAQVLNGFLDLQSSHRSALRELARMQGPGASPALKVLVTAAKAFQNMAESRWTEAWQAVLSLQRLGAPSAESLDGMTELGGRSGQTPASCKASSGSTMELSAQDLCDGQLSFEWSEESLAMDYSS
jgi:hypothetical protein